MGTDLRRSRARPFAVAAAWAWLLTGPAVAASAIAPPAAYEPTEIEVKAAFLYHFAQLVTWPEAPEAGPAGPIVIAIVGVDPFGDRLEATIGDETIRGRSLKIERVAKPADLSAVPHILFVGSADVAEVQRALEAVAKAPTLTVGVFKGFARQGGMIEFRVTADSRVAFDINLRAVGAAGLKMSSQLLKIARIVDPGR
jgi:YfiR/HmsC-like